MDFGAFIIGVMSSCHPDCLYVKKHESLASKQNILSFILSNVAEKLHFFMKLTLQNEELEAAFFLMKLRF